MKSHEVLKQACKKKGPKNVAAHLNLSLATVHQWSRPPKPKGTGIINPLDRIAAIQEFTGEKQLAQWICQRAGGFFVENPLSKVSARAEFLTATAGVMRELAHLQAEVARVLGDKNVTQAECEELRKHWEKSKSDTERYVKECEAGCFQTAANVSATFKSRPYAS